MTQTPTETDADMQRADEPERHVGFTGTRHGMARPQAAKVAGLISGYDWLHHGDCVGSDAHAHDDATDEGVSTEGHPSTIVSLRANCITDRTNPPKPPLVRNRDIVDHPAVERLIAAPREMTEQLHGGTWSTVRYAKRVGKPVSIVFPDGSVRDE